MKYILALLNSKLYYFWLYFRGKRKGEILELIATPLKEVPIKIISEEKQQPFIEIVDRILCLNHTQDNLQNRSKQQKSQEFQKQIDQKVYELYELTPEEIKVVKEFKK